MSGVMLFHRDFRGYSGGHGKVWDYFNHALAAGWDARVFLTPESLRDDSNPWLTMPGRIEREWRPERADVLFLGGMDWQALPPERAHADQPVINLVQHVRHADPAQPLRAFLPRRALRICVSAPVAEAIAATGEVDGPVEVIEAALSLPGGVAIPADREGVFVGAIKQPALGRSIADTLRSRGIAVDLCIDWVSREEYLARLARAAVAVMLPHATEGFFLPGLEAMALGCATVVPDGVGNRAYARDQDNCLMPPLDADAVLSAVERLLADAGLRERLMFAGRQTVARFDPASERRRFHALLGALPSWWRT